MAARPSLLVLLAGAAGLAAIGHGAAISAAAEPETRLGASIQQSAVDRDKAAARRQRALDLREQAAQATEARLQAAVPPAGAGPQRSGAGGAEAEVEDQYDELARIYQSMKPAKAALVFEQLAMDVQMKVAKKMRERSAAMIMACMTPNGAAALTMALARNRPVERRARAAATQPPAAK